MLGFAVLPLLHLYYRLYQLSFTEFRASSVSSENYGYRLICVGWKEFIYLRQTFIPAIYLERRAQKVM